MAPTTKEEEQELATLDATVAALITSEDDVPSDDAVLEDIAGSARNEDDVFLAAVADARGLLEKSESAEGCDDASEDLEEEEIKRLIAQVTRLVSVLEPDGGATESATAPKAVSSPSSAEEECDNEEEEENRILIEQMKRLVMEIDPDGIAADSTAAVLSPSKTAGTAAPAHEPKKQTKKKKAVDAGIVMQAPKKADTGERGLLELKSYARSSNKKKMDKEKSKWLLAAKKKSTTAANDDGEGAVPNATATAVPNDATIALSDPVELEATASTISDKLTAIAPNISNTWTKSEDCESEQNAPPDKAQAERDLRLALANLERVLADEDDAATVSGNRGVGAALKRLSKRSPGRRKSEAAVARARVDLRSAMANVKAQVPATKRQTLQTTTDHPSTHEEKATLSSFKTSSKFPSFNLLRKKKRGFGQSATGKRNGDEKGLLEKGVGKDRAAPPPARGARRQSIVEEDEFREGVDPVGDMVQNLLQQASSLRDDSFNVGSNEDGGIEERILLKLMVFCGCSDGDEGTIRERRDDDGRAHLTEAPRTVEDWYDWYYEDELAPDSVAPTEDTREPRPSIFGLNKRRDVKRDGRDGDCIDSTEAPTTVLGWLDWALE